MAKKARYLPGNKGTETPSNLVFVDTESYSFPVAGRPDKTELKLRLWCASRVRLENNEPTRRQEADGETADTFWSFLDSVSDRHRPTWVFAHNLAHDLTQLDFWRMLENEHFTIGYANVGIGDTKGSKGKGRNGKLVVEDGTNYIRCFRNGRCFVFNDTCNLWPKGLASLAKDFGTDKHNTPTSDSSGEDWLRYCRRDVDIIETAVRQLLVQWKYTNSGVFKMTAAMLSLTNFQHTCDVRTPDGRGIDIVCRPDSKEHELERGSYFGGRNCCYFVGEIRGRIYHVDCNSLYPFVMERECYPRRFVRYHEGMTNAELRDTMRVYGCIAQVSICSRFETFPVRINGNQYHCTGRFWTTLCGPELQRAIDSQSIYRIGHVQSYSVGPLFTKWVDYWYDRKLKAIAKGIGGLGELEFCKLILNSLSGKWAQRGRHWRDVPGRIPLSKWGPWTEYDGETNEWTSWRAIAGNAQRLHEAEEPPHSFPAISAFITAYGREYMRWVISLLPEGSVYYLATDALLINEYAYRILEANGLIHPTEIGRFKLLGIYREAKIHGPNWYELDGQTVATGIYGKLVSAKQKGENVDVWERTPSLIATGPRNSTVLTSVKAEIPKPDFRGIINSEGRWVPYRLSMDPDFADRPKVYACLPAYLLDSQADRTLIVD